MPISKTTGVLIILGLLVLGAAAYLLFGGSGGAGVTAEAPPATVAEQTFLALTSRIDPVALDTKVLSDPRFLMLEDIRVVVLPEDAGRIDPFAPLGL